MSVFVIIYNFQSLLTYTVPLDYTVEPEKKRNGILSHKGCQQRESAMEVGKTIMNFWAKCDGEDPYQKNQLQICFHCMAVSHKTT